MQELDSKKEELDDNKRKLEKLIEETTPQKQKMPRFVNMAHLGIVHNRILSKVQKSFCSCTHVNSVPKYILYVNLHILLNILCKAT